MRIPQNYIHNYMCVWAYTHKHTSGYNFVKINRNRKSYMKIHKTVNIGYLWV